MSQHHSALYCHVPDMMMSCLDVTDFTSQLHGEKGREVHKTLTFATAETETDEEGRRVWK